MKILHATCLNRAKDHSGVLQQLSYEYEATNAQGLDWQTMSFSIDKSPYPFARTFPRGFRNALMRRFYFFAKMISLSHNYDAILIRYLNLDPFLLILSIATRNILTVHHFGIKRENDSPLDKANRLLLKLILMINGKFVAVTKGIGKDINKQLALNAQFFVYTNGITTKPKENSKKQAVYDKKVPLEIAFIASNFYPWNGLEALADSSINCDANFVVHIIGRLNERSRRKIESTALGSTRFLIHGPLEPNEIELILSRCRIGIGTLQPQNTGLADACPLKTREYLNAGLLAYNGLPDAGLPDDFPFFRCGPASIRMILEFAQKHTSTHPRVVRESALPYIDKKTITHSLAKNLKQMQGQRII